MSKRRMAEVMRERQRFGQVLVQPKCACERARDLHDFQRMCQPGAKMVAFMKNEYLCLVLQAPKGGGVDDAVAIAPKVVARRVRGLAMQTPAAPSGMRG